MLLDLQSLGARGVLVAGCSVDRCRFDTGARLAAAQTERARAILELRGGDPARLRSDWSASRGSDPLDESILQMLIEITGPGAAKVDPATH
jgi:coenzyme F420-reducing hydrogenase delta subunit